MKPKLFIGSSTQRLPIARALKEILTDCVDVSVWDDAPEFVPGESILDALFKIAAAYDFALLIFGQDDKGMMGHREVADAVNALRMDAGASIATVRDNVLFELGLFMGRMGKDRALWLNARGSKASHTATDLGGIVHLAFDEPEVMSTETLIQALDPTRAKICERISALGCRSDRTGKVIAVKRALCLATSQYSEARFKEDIDYIHRFFSEQAVTSEQGLTAARFQSYFEPGNAWDIVHLGLYIDAETQEMVFDAPSAAGRTESLPVQAIEPMIKDCGAQLVVIITCDSLRFGNHLARFTNVIAGHQIIAPRAALSWAKVFYENISKRGMSLFAAFERAQDMADPGLILLARENVRFIPATAK